MKLSEPKRKQLSEWLAATRVRLLASGLSELELDLMRLRDLEGLTHEAIGEKFGKSRSFSFYHYSRLRRRLRHPARRSFVPEFLVLS